MVMGIVLSSIINMPAIASQSQKTDMDEWLKAHFGTQHEQLIPIVAVADMYFSCNKQKNTESNVTIKALITQIDKNELAQMLIQCLDGKTPKSDLAINYGLSGCFNEQFHELSAVEKQEKMRLVAQKITTLSRKERQKSLTKCVTVQAINYLK